MIGDRVSSDTAAGRRPPLRPDAIRHTLVEWLTSDAWPFDRPSHPPSLT